jgi:hypothetical protein
VHSLYHALGKRCCDLFYQPGGGTYTAMAARQYKYTFSTKATTHYVSNNKSGRERRVEAAEHHARLARLAAQTHHVN